jgi:hypothetical protein
MKMEYDYLAIERHEQPAGSFLSMLKDLVVSLRYLREGIPANEISSHMPEMRSKEKKLQEIDAKTGESQRNYIQEIWDVLENEPEDDPQKSFQIFELRMDDKQQATFIPIYESFPQHILAEEWAKERGTPGLKYIILEVVES